MAAAPLSVAEALGLAKSTLYAVGHLVVVGEVSGFSGPNARSGHCYFELKDEEASMAIIVWRSTYAHLGFELKDGMEVQITGAFDVYVRSGRMSFVASKVEVTGEGALRQKVAALAKKLAAEGLMDERTKLKVPAFCERVCVVTSLSGSVKDDVVRTLGRRNRLVEITLVSCSVQGNDAPPTIISALKAAEALAPDAVLLVRGGGSYEDLMAFNDEGLARVIAGLSVPVVTGIGHEPDVTIADLVASRRQSTPTAAAESVAPAMSQLADSLEDRARRLKAEATRRLEGAQAAIDGVASRLPLALSGLVRRRQERLVALSASRVLRDPTLITADRARDLDRQEERIAEALPRGLKRQGELQTQWATRANGVIQRFLERHRAALGARASELQALSPKRVLARGYAILRTRGGSVIDSAHSVRVGEGVIALLGEGSLEAEVTAVHASDEAAPASRHRAE